ncbi:hypothetical protein SAMN05216480_12210 [Pustulibacterium marinum]|uniref:Uncharacterized protein n=1 Tax=Pustulibacterium marinum TaxID=1224947 RepID=A0A1I7IU99_9FLAO|nr:hypothetical protein SAMN05216480_12210 [Pustulibacterium marinum]
MFVSIFKSSVYGVDFFGIIYHICGQLRAYSVYTYLFLFFTCKSGVYEF